MTRLRLLVSVIAACLAGCVDAERRVAPEREHGTASSSARASATPTADVLPATARCDSPTSASNAPTRALPATFAADFTKVDARARAWLASSELPGAALLVVRDGNVLHEAYYGEYDAETVVPIASASKWLAGALVLALVDRKTLALDEPVSKYVTEFTGDKATITVRQLFDHTSGLPSESGERGGPLSTLERAARDLARVKLVSPPGRVFRYGGDAMQVGGRVVEIAGGASWNELFQKHVAQPLGLEHTQWGRFGLSRNPQIAGGASATLVDYGRFVRMLLAGGELDGKRVLSESAVRELVTDRTGDAEIASVELTRRVGSRGYGVGCWVERKDARGVTTAASSPGAFGFWPYVDFEQRVAVIWMICDRKREHVRGEARFDAVRHVYEALGLPPRE